MTIYVEWTSNCSRASSEQARLALFPSGIHG